MIIKDDKIVFRCFEYKKNTIKDFDNELSKRFKNIYQFSNSDNNKFLLLLRKGFYPYEYIDCWN